MAVVKEEDVLISPQMAVSMIKGMFDAEGSSENVPKIVGGSFAAVLKKDGIVVNNLRDSPHLPWSIFKAAVQVLQEEGETAKKGAAMAGKLGSEKLPKNSVEGYIAHKVYGIQVGMSVFRHI